MLSHAATRARGLASRLARLRHGRRRGARPLDGLVLDPSLQPDVERAISMVQPFSMLSRNRLSILYELVAYVDTYCIAGALVECGVWKGGAVGMMAYAARTRDGQRDLHLFDAFADICEPDHRIDGARAVGEAGGLEYAQGRLQSIQGIYSDRGGHGTLEECRSLIETRIGYDPARVHYHAGWFQDSLPTAAPVLGPIAILRIDADWYASTKVCLDALYSLVSPGGAVIVDDYGAYDGCRLAVDEFLSAHRVRVFLNHVDTECIYWFRETRGGNVAAGAIAAHAG